MAFTDTEMAVLSQLVYKNDIISNKMCLPLDIVLKNQEKSLLKDLGPQYKNIIAELIKKSHNYNIDLATNDEKTGFAAMAISGPDKEVSVVCRGTEGFNLDNEESRKDILNGDAGLIFGTGKTDQHKEMEKFLDKLKKHGYDSYSFVGHSLGGNLAMYGAIYIADTGKVKGVTTFNAPNFNSAFCLKHKKEIDKIKYKTVHYQTEYDVVSSINEENTFGQVVVCEVVNASNNPLDFDTYHLLSGFSISSNSFDFSENGKQDISNALGGIVTNGAPIVIDSLSSGIATTILTGNIFLGAAVFVGKLVATALTVAFVTYVYNNVKEWMFQNSSGYKSATANPYISINTNTMRSYADQLANLSRRAKNLDKKMNSLYFYAGFDWNVARTVRTLGALLKAEIVLDFAQRLDKNVSYLRETANEFDSVERTISSMLG